MRWADALVEGLRKAELRHIPYVADAPLDHVIRRLAADPFFHLLPLSREDEGVGVLIGAHLAGQGGALLMQSSGFGQ
ncbi:MAG: hypothetical protein HY660_09915, partial [Armatimonadetes bacterium]|nr:hypothetical protein [Armatimonadota bacterium]